jgi:hypothetical protein
MESSTRAKAARNALARGPCLARERRNSSSPEEPPVNLKKKKKKATFVEESIEIKAA